MHGNDQMKCLNDYELERLVAGDAQIRRVLWERHLAACPECRRRGDLVQQNRQLEAEIQAILLGTSVRPGHGETPPKNRGDRPKGVGKERGFAPHSESVATHRRVSG